MHAVFRLIHARESEFIGGFIPALALLALGGLGLLIRHRKP